MSKNAEDKIPEIQSSFIQNFLKSRLGKDALISSNFRKEYSKCLSLFLFYLATIAKHNQSEQKKKLTKNCIIKALSDIGFEDFAEQLQDFKQTLPQQQNNRQSQVDSSQATDQIGNSDNQKQQHNIDNEDNVDEVASDEEVQQEIEGNENGAKENTNLLDQIIVNQQAQQQEEQSSNALHEELF